MKLIIAILLSNGENINPKELMTLFEKFIQGKEYIESIDKLFGGSNWGLGKYGVDQGILRDLKMDLVRYNAFLNYLEQTYQLSAQDAVRTVELLDSIGACTYAAFANTIFASYIGRPGDFEKDFGIPMYTTDGYGNQIFNDAQLLADLYIFFNSKSNGGKIFDDSLGKTVIDNNFVSNNGLTEQEYVSYSSGLNTVKINSYLDSKSNGLEIKTTGTVKGYLGNNAHFIHYPIPPSEDEVKSKVQQAMINEEQVTLNIFPDTSGEIILQDVINSNNDVTFAGNHAMFVTRADNDGVMVSSWGKDYFISYEDLVNSGEYRFDFSTLTEEVKSVSSFDLDSGYYF